MKHFTKIFGSLAVVLVFYSLILGGFDLGQHRYQVAVPNLIVGFFWFLILGVVAAEQVSDAKFKAEMKFLDKTSAMLKGLVEAEEARNTPNDHQEKMAELLVDCVDEITKQTGDGERKAPTQEQADAAAALFHEKTGDHYARMTIVAGGVKAEIGTDPFESAEQVPGRSPAHEAARVRGDKARAKQIPVTDGDEPQKPLTKSQQRRKNTKLGIGPITDDEVRENKNAKRRAARAAKKAELEQTKLV